MIGHKLLDDVKKATCVYYTGVDPYFETERPNSVELQEKLSCEKRNKI